MRRVISGLVGAALIASAGWAQVAPRPMPQIRPPVPAPPIVRVPESPPPEFNARNLLPATTALYQAYVRDGRVPGIVGAFAVSDYPTLYVSAGGISAEPGASAAGPDSLWRVYSMTKPVTAMAAMILIEEGKIGLDDPLSKYFPAFAHMRVMTDPDRSLASRPATHPITIRELLTHTAGLGYSIVTKGPLLHEYERLGIVPFASDTGTEAKLRPTRPATLAEFANRVATLPLIAEPGTKWSYSIGLDVMGAVIERASGMPFDAFVQARLFGPLRMTDSWWQVPAAAAPRLATVYAYLGDTRTVLDPGVTSVFLQRPSFPYGGAGLVTSARDYDRFLHMIASGGILDGVRVLKPETVALATSNLLPPGVFFRGMSGDGTPNGFGAGGSVTLADGPGGFPGKGTYGWSGAAGTLAWVDPVRHFRGTVMVNYFPADRVPLRVETARALAADSRNTFSAEMRKLTEAGPGTNR
ncbi:serine hydrolase domain-containing protein [uncultured Sphingomonas sp.]|uniref:serine hydrolase domain-containing protein n=1 Tax=uncultured Sphingomonas sp. TaxID=158754 RepID=UPI0035C967B2